MSYSCAENVAQLSRARDGLSILQESIKKKEDSPTKSCSGFEIAEQANKKACMFITSRVAN